MDLEKLKNFKKEYRILERKVKQLVALNDKLEEEWDKLRWDCGFLCPRKEICEHDPAELEICKIATCPRYKMIS